MSIVHKIERVFVIKAGSESVLVTGSFAVMLSVEFAVVYLPEASFQLFTSLYLS